MNGVDPLSTKLKSDIQAMKNSFFLNLLTPGDQNTSVVSWVFLDGSKDKDDRIEDIKTGSLSDFSAQLGSVDGGKASGKSKKTSPRIVAVLPGHQVTYARLVLPTSSKKKILQAIPFAVEEFVIGDIDEMSIVVGDFNPDGSVRVAVVKKSLLQQWASLFQDAGLVIDCMIGQPDMLTLDEPDMAVVLLKDNLLLFKSAEHCYQFDGDNLATSIELMPALMTKKFKVLFDKTSKQSGKFARQFKLEKEADGDVAVELAEFSGNLYEVFQFDAERLRGRIDLLSDSASRDVDSFTNPYALLPMAYAFACLAVIYMAINFCYAYYFHKKTEGMIANAESHYKRLFPDDKLVDLKSQWAARLGRLTEDSVDRSFSRVFPLVMASFSDNKASKTSFELDKFKYDSESGELRVDVDLKSIAVLESVKNDLKQKGYELEIVSANEEKDLVKASILVKAL